MAATLAEGDPPPDDDDLEDWDDWDPRDLPDESKEAAPAPGWGFGADGALDVLRPGPMLSELADAAHVQGRRQISDDELTGLIKAWRRITSWATARELAAIAELARRRPDDIDTALGQKMTARLRAAGQVVGKDSGPGGPPSSTPSSAAGAAASAPAASAPVASASAPAAPVSASASAPAPAPAPALDLPELISPFVSDEVAAALTLTMRAAEAHLDLATDLATKLPMTAAALESGLIDLIRARIIAEATRVLTQEQAAAVERLIFPRAGQQTSGQLRAALARAILAVDPDAARRRREQAQREARVLRWREDAGTAALCGRDLPSAEVLAADQRISARARELKSAGLVGTMDELRARAYLDFLLGRSGLPEPGIKEPGASADAGSDTADPLGPDGRPARPDVDQGRADTGSGGADAGSGGADAGPWPTGGPPGGLAARINVTVPLSTLLGTSDVPGEVAAFGPVDAELARELARAAGMHPATRWCVTVVGQHGQPVGHGCARGRHSAPEPPAAGPDGSPAGGPAHGSPAGGPAHGSPVGGPAHGPPHGGGLARDRPAPNGQRSRDPASEGPGHLLTRDFLQRLRIRITPLAVGTCDHRNEEPGYKPSRSLRHLIGARTVTCTAPGCRRPAAQCDDDHTIPYEAGGRTCECNLGPLCRRHHRCKQARGWALEQPSPGIMVWTTPAGRRYRTVATSYSV